ncbi:hypothetical protein [Devosia sp. A369]
MGWTWRNVAGYVALAFVVWLVFYTVEWRIRTNGEVDLGDAFFAWLGRVVMLEWVYRYQALGAGVLAFLAGAFVFMNGVADRRSADSQRSEERYERSLTTIMRVRERFYRVENELLQMNRNAGYLDRQQRNLTRAIDQLEHIERELVQAYNVGSEFGAWLGGASQQISDAIEVATMPTATADDVKRLLGIAHAAWLVLKDPTLLLTDGGYYRRHQVWLSDDDKSALSASGVTRDDVWASKQYLQGGW